MGIAVSVFAQALVLSFVVEAVLEYFIGIWWKPLSLSAENRKKLAMAIGLIIGVILASAYNIDLLAVLGLPSSPVGKIITGAVIGRGSTYLHGFWKKVTGQ